MKERSIYDLLIDEELRWLSIRYRIEHFVHLRKVSSPMAAAMQLKFGITPFLMATTDIRSAPIITSHIRLRRSILSVDLTSCSGCVNSSS